MYYSNRINCYTYVLQALVPGARPLSINEVRLSKDDDEDKDRYRVSEKWHNSTEDVNDNQSDDESNAQKNGATKKGDTKIDNHIGKRILEHLIETIYEFITYIIIIYSSKA